MTKRAFSFVVLAVVAVLLFAACSPPSGPATGGSAGAVQGTGGTGGTLPGGTGGSSTSIASGATSPAPASASAAGVTPAAAAAATAPAAKAPAAAASPSTQVVYAPPKLEDAPANMRDSVILGGSILTDTQKVLAGTVGNKLTCSNCHFNGGLTQGGKNGGISLVGVGAKYPTFTSRHGSTDLALRTFD